MIRSVQAEEFVYPKYEIPLAEAYGGRFESVFVVLHPFVQVPVSLAWSVTQKYPSDEQILAEGTKCPWAEVQKLTGIASYARMNQALLTSIGSLEGDLADWAGRDAIAKFVQSHPVWMPAEGRFEPLLQADFLEVFAAAGQEELVFVPEFPNSDPVVRLPIEELKSGAPFPPRGTLLAPDSSFLFTVDWDSFFALFYGPRAFVAESARKLSLEGFFASANTEHAWFNYSFGCATVTVSPEDWPAA
jgi:hypothetical protein